MAHNYQAQNGAASHPNYPPASDPMRSPAEYWQGDHRGARPQDYDYPPNNEYPTQYHTPQNQQYEQPPQQWRRPTQQQIQQPRYEVAPSRHGEYQQGQAGYLQQAPSIAPQYGPQSNYPQTIQQPIYNTNMQHLQHSQGPPRQDVYRAQIPQQPMYEEPREHRPLKQRAYSDERVRAPDQTNPSYTRHARVDGNPVSRLEGKPTSNLKPSNGENRKPAKEKILTTPVSPETLSWDNPFPTFPTNKKKPASSDADAKRPDTAGSSRSQEPVRKQSGAVDVDTSESHQPRSSHPRPTFNHSAPQSYQSNGSYPSEASGVVHARNQAVRQAQGSHSELPLRQMIQKNGISQSGYSPAINNSAPTSPWRQQFNGVSHKEHSSPAETVEPGSYTTRSPTAYANAPWDNGAQSPSYAVPQHQNATQYPNDTSASRPIDQTRSQSLDIDRSNHYNNSQYQPLRAAPQQHPSHEQGYEDKIDSYFEPASVQKRSDQYAGPNKARSPAEGDMPNFDALPSQRPGIPRGNSIDQHLNMQPHQHDIPATSGNDRGRSHGREQAPGFAGYAHRSRSQPNGRGPQSPEEQAHGFDFGAANIAPPIPLAKVPSGPTYHNEIAGNFSQMELSAASNPRRPSTEANRPMNGQPRRSPQQMPHNGAPQYTNGHQMRSPIQIPISGPRTGMPNPQRGLSDSREQPYGPGSSQVPRVSPNNPRSPNYAPPSDSHRMNPGMGPRPGTAPSPTDRRGPTPPTTSSRPPNPDALPEHPTPVRPGLMQGPSQIQPKPPPVRQYNSVTSPNSGSNPSQQIPSVDSVKLPKTVDSGPVTHQELQRLQQIVQAHPNDQKTQLLYAQKMAEAASVLVDERADQKTRNRTREKYIMDAHKLVKKLVTAGYPDAMFYLADCHGRGLLGLQEDPKEAFNLYQSAAKVGHAQSAYRVAVCCEMGPDDGGGTRRDPLKAVQWYKRAAALGDTPAMYKMGMIQLKGLLGQPKSTREAVVWLKRAAERADEENPHALHELGLLYESANPSDTILRDEAYSFQLFTQAANLGYKFSQFRLGAAYEYGHLGCPIDPRQSISWYSKAAVQEEHQSELALSGWYLTGAEGVLAQSDTEAYLWARKAANAGLAKAEYAMGYFTEVGIGSKADVEGAKRWYWKASAQGFGKARERLEDLRKGGATKRKERVSRSAVNKQSEGDCRIM